MIIWKGWGILVVLIAGVLAGLGGAGMSAVLGTDQGSMVGASGGLAVAAVAVYFVGQRLNAPVPGYHPQTGQPVLYRNSHTLFFIPMQYWSFLLLAASVAVLFGALASP